MRTAGHFMKRWVYSRLQCPTFMRQTLVEWAAQTIIKSFWAREYYQQKREKGSTYQGRSQIVSVQIDTYSLPLLAEGCGV